MIVWGGRDPQLGFFRTGGRYNPLTDTWTPTTTTNAPTARSINPGTGIWTGTEMIVWGGFREVPSIDHEYLNTGGRYNPATDSWVATQVINAPCVRDSFFSAWTGNEMIVWGGFAQGTQSSPGCPENLGGRYNPINDSWTRMTTVNSPTSRSAYGVAWTGREMIVGGGS